MINIEHFKDEVVVPTLTELSMYSEAAVQLVIGTAIQESRLHYLKQIPSGIAKGVCQNGRSNPQMIYGKTLSLINLKIKTAPTRHS